MLRRCIFFLVQETKYINICQYDYFPKDFVSTYVIGFGFCIWFYILANFWIFIDV